MKWIGPYNQAMEVIGSVVPNMNAAPLGIGPEMLLGAITTASGWVLVVMLKALSVKTGGRSRYTCYKCNQVHCAIGKVATVAKEVHSKFKRVKEKLLGEKAAENSCDEAETEFARTACDIHCVQAATAFLDGKLVLECWPALAFSQLLK